MIRNNQNKTNIPLRQKTILVILGLFLTLIILEVGLHLGGFILLSLQEYRNRTSFKQNLGIKLAQKQIKLKATSRRK